MSEISEQGRRRAFGAWLRTGKVPAVTTAEGIELKFNPWHDPRDGRFTFVGAGQYHARGARGGTFGGGGATGRDDWPVRPSRSTMKTQRRPPVPKSAPSAGGKPPIPNTRARTSSAGWTGGGFTGGGGGRTGGGGATATEAWGSSEPKRRPIASNSSPSTIVSSNRAAATDTGSARTASAPDEGHRTVLRNGYTYRIDARERTRRVSGLLTVARVPVRSRTAQRQAGGAERRASDDGGHYIAVRFNGPTDAFNHFAQDANFNRGGYRVLEDEWARDKRAGRAVTVKIVPKFDDASVRPSAINVWWTVDDKTKSLRFPNERVEIRREK